MKRIKNEVTTKEICNIETQIETKLIHSCIVHTNYVQC